MSPFHFQRVFARVAGENVGQVVRRLRLERAAWQLQNTNLRILEIASQAGFESPEAFARAFRAAFASPATDFREAEWLSHSLGTPNGAHFSPGAVPEFQPLSIRGQGVPFGVREVDEIALACRRHPGSPRFLAKSLRALATELKPGGFDSSASPMITFALKLGPDIPVSEVESFVAVRFEEGGTATLDRATVGGGPHLCSRYEGAETRTGAGLGDYWFRFWAEALPASRTTIRPGPSFQEIRFSRGPNDEFSMCADLYVPVAR